MAGGCRRFPLVYSRPVTRSKTPKTNLQAKAPTRELRVSADAQSRLAAARAWLARLPRDAEALVLAPHGLAADLVVRDEVSSAGTRFGVQRFTVDRLAARLAAPELARRGAATTTSLSLAAVVTRAVQGLLGSGAAGRFAEIGGRPGFPHAVVRTLEELRGAGI